MSGGPGVMRRLPASLQPVLRAFVVLWTLLAMVPLCPARAAGAGDSDPSAAGLALAQAVYDRPDGGSMAARARMVLASPGSTERVRDFYSYRLDAAAGEVRSLIRFVTPANVAGTGLLVHSRRGKADDQWLFLPALERIRRVSSESRGGRFVQSGIYYEDLQDRPPAEDSHRLLGTDDYEGVEALLLESVPGDPASSQRRKADRQRVIALGVERDRLSVREIGGCWTECRRCTVGRDEKRQTAAHCATGFDCVFDFLDADDRRLGGTDSVRRLVVEFEVVLVDGAHGVGGVRDRQLEDDELLTGLRFAAEIRVLGVADGPLRACVPPERDGSCRLGKSPIGSDRRRLDPFGGVGE